MQECVKKAVAKKNLGGNGRSLIREKVVVGLEILWDNH